MSFIILHLSSLLFYLHSICSLRLSKWILLSELAFKISKMSLASFSSFLVLQLTSCFLRLLFSFCRNQLAFFSCLSSYLVLQSVSHRYSLVLSLRLPFSNSQNQLCKALKSLQYPFKKTVNCPILSRESSTFWFCQVSIFLVRYIW